jgi:hypothetical protein
MNTSRERERMASNSGSTSRPTFRQNPANACQSIKTVLLTVPQLKKRATRAMTPVLAEKTVRSGISWSARITRLGYSS